MLKDKLKIITVHFLFGQYGGAEVIAYNSFKILEKYGHESYFFSMNTKPYWEENYSYAKFFCKNVEKKNFWQYLRNIPRAYYNRDSLKNFGAMLDEIKPDIVHIHTLGTLTYSVVDACKKRNIPVVKTEHSALIACPSESFFYKNKKYCNKQLCVKGNYSYCLFNKCCSNSFYLSLVGSLKNWFNDKMNFYNNIQKFISPSNAVAEILVKKGIPEDKICVVENFLEAKFESEPCYTKGNYFLFVGRLYSFKGIQNLIEAMNTLPKDIKLHVAGTGPLELSLKQYCKNNGLNNIKFCGFLSRDRIIEEYKNCIAVITPSIWFENFPTTSLESFINGKPVIGSNIGGIPQQVEHNKTGLLFEPSNTEQLKECILAYWNNPELAVEHGKNAYQKAKNYYIEERYYNELLKVYNEVLHKEKL